jgi:MFS family permease
MTRRRVFYGWRVIAGLFVILMVSSGLGFYGQAVYLRALVDERGWSTGMTSGGTALFFLSSGLAGYVSAPYLNRVDVRRVICIGAVIGAAGLVLVGQVQQEWQMFAANALFGVGFALAGLVPATTTVARWFNRRRSVALSVASTGLSAGGIVVTPFAAALVEDRGIAAMTPIFAALWVVVIVPVAVLVVRSSPADVGLEVDGEVVAVGQAPRAPTGSTFAEVRASRFYLLATTAYVFVMLAQVGGISQQVKLVGERVPHLASLSVTLVAAASVVGRLGGGVLVTKVSTKVVTTVLIVVQSVALVGFAFADTAVSVVLSCVVFGLSVGNLLMLHPLLLVEAYGVREYSKIYSSSQLFMTIGVGLGPTVLGVLHDVSDYRLSFLVAAGSSLLALGLFAAAGPVRAPAPSPAAAAALQPS